jgi:LysM repeat protein
MRSRSGTFCLRLVLLGILVLGAASCANTPPAAVTPSPAATRPPATRPAQAAGTTPQPTGAVSASTPAPTPAATTFVHRVRRGEMLRDIARQYGCTVDELIRLNQIDDPDLIKVGQEILIPVSSGERTPQAVCSCLGNLYNCADLGTQAQAQACFAYCRAIGEGDIHQLDGDGSGIVCKSLP